MTTEDYCCINNTGNEVIEPLARSSDWDDIIRSAQERMALKPSECFSVEDSNGDGPYDGLTWEKLDKILEDCTPKKAEPVEGRNPSLCVMVPTHLCRGLQVDYVYVVPRNDSVGSVNLCYAGDGIFDIVQLTPEAIEVLMNETGCSLQDCLITKDQVDMRTLYSHIHLWGNESSIDFRDSLGYRAYLLSEQPLPQYKYQPFPKCSDFDVDEYLKDLAEREQKEKELVDIKESLKSGNIPPSPGINGGEFYIYLDKDWLGNLNACDLPVVKEGWLARQTKKYSEYVRTQTLKMINFRFR